MSTPGLTISTPSMPQAIDARDWAWTIARRVLQGVGGAAAVGFAAAMPWAQFTAAGVIVGTIRLPTALLAGTGLLVAAGLVLLGVSAWGLISRLTTRTRLGILAVLALTLLSLAGLEYGVYRGGGLSAYEYRPAARLLAYMLGIALLACSIPEDIGPRTAVLLRAKHLRVRHVLMLALGATAAGGLLGAVALDGMPHVIDGTAYLLEARMLWSGSLALDPPMHPELFATELIAFRLTDAGYFAKYPIGWPILLGGFDAIGVPWLANAALAGVLVVLTYLVVAERGGKRLAGLSAAVVALCPWLWMNAATMLSHLASAVWLWLFLWLLLRTIRTRSRLVAALCGLALGAAVLTRPADAAFFALPCACAAIGWMVRRPSVWLTRLPLVALGALPGVLVYAWVNARLSGNAAAGYGGGYANDFLRQAPDSAGHALIWLQQSWVGVSSHWFNGVLPAGMLVGCGVVFGRKMLRGQWLVFACALCLLLCYGVFVFGGRAWVGPRWYVPLIPAGAVLVAAGLEAATRAARVRSPSGVLAAGHLRAMLVAYAVLFLVALPTRVFELNQWPPHGIDGRVAALVEQAGVTNAVVALPVDGLDPVTGQPNYKRGIAGMWAMQTPLEHSDVIFVSAVAGWQAMAAEAWPGRRLLVMNATAGDWALNEVTNPVTPPNEPTP